MSDINFLSTIELGKIQTWEDKKAASITPISFPGQDSGKTEGVDTLGIIAYINISGRLTGNYELLQNAIFNIRDIADGAQVSSSVMRSPFVNGRDGSNIRRQGMIGRNTTATASKLIDASANFSTAGITTSDKVKNMITGVVTTISSVDSETQLTLGSDIFPSTGTGYAVTASINTKILSFNYRWELPALSYVDYQLSIMQVK